MDVDIDEGDGHLTVRPRGCLSLRTAGDLRDALLKAAAEQPQGVVCDLRAMTAGAVTLTVLHVVADQLAEWPGTPLALVATEPYLCGQLSRLGVARRMPVVGTPRAAVAALRRAPARLSATTTLAATTAAPAAARAFATDTLEGWHAAGAVGAACQVVSELVANAVVHARTGAAVRVGLRGGRVGLSVADRGTGSFPALRDTHRKGAEGGWGLRVVAELSRCWGVLPRLGAGWVVWSVLDLPVAPPGLVPRQAPERV